MPTFVMMTRLSPESVEKPQKVEELNRQVEDSIREQCPEVRWISNLAVLGPHDYLDVFEAPDTDTAAKVSLLVRSLGHASSEVWVATPWSRFVGLARELGDGQ